MSRQTPTILVAGPFTSNALATFRAAAPHAEFLLSDSAEVTEQQAHAADVIVGNIAPDLLTHAPHLAWVQLLSAGSNRYDTPGVLPEGTVLTNSVGAYGQAVSEHLFAMTWSLMKQLPAYRDFQNQRLWDDAGPVTSLADATVIILGLGNIGLHYARLATGVGAHVIGVKRSPIEPPDGVDRVVTNDHLPKVLGNADVVVSFLPLSEQTRGLCNADFFAAMKPGSYFLNGGRGATVDTESLVEALKTQHLGSAGLDVTDPEPLPTDSPLWGMSNVIITPHVAGGFHLPGVLDAVSEIAADNLRRFVVGESLHNVVSTD